jgi:hypothetical protein
VFWWNAYLGKHGHRDFTDLSNHIKTRKGTSTYVVKAIHQLATELTTDP